MIYNLEMLGCGEESSRLDNLDLPLECGRGLHFLNVFEVFQRHDIAFHSGHLSCDSSISIVRPCWKVFNEGKESDVETSPRVTDDRQGQF